MLLTTTTMAPPTAATTTATTTTTNPLVVEVNDAVEGRASDGDDGTRSNFGNGGGGGGGGGCVSVGTPSSSSSSSCPVSVLAKKFADNMNMSPSSSSAASAAANAAHALERASSRAAELIRHDSKKRGGSSSSRGRSSGGGLLGSHSSHGSSRCRSCDKGDNRRGSDDGDGHRGCRNGRGSNHRGSGGSRHGGRSSSFDAAEELERRDSSRTFQSTMKRISRRPGPIESPIDSPGENGKGHGVSEDGGGANEANDDNSSGMCPRVDPEDRQVIRTFMLADVRTRRYRLRTYKRVFVGSAVVDALVSNGLASSRDEAVRLGRRVEHKYKLFEHVHRRHMFEDEFLFYRFKRKTRDAEEKGRESEKSHTTAATARTSTSGGGGGEVGGRGSNGSRGDTAERKDSEASGMSLVTCSSCDSSSDDEEEGDGNYPCNGGRCPFSSSSNSSSSSSSSCPLGANIEPTASSEEMGMEIVHALRTGLEIRDRKYHGRTYKNCFVGRDAVSLLIEGGYTDCRVEAVVVANVVGRWYDLFEHVSGGCPFRHSYLEDDHIFYRFKERREPRHSRTPRSSGQSSPSTSEGEARTGPLKEYSFTTADRDNIARQWIEIFKKVDVRDRTWRLKPYHAVFVGSEAVDLLVKMSLARSRADAVRIGRIVNSQLHLFEHVAGEHEFDDEYLFFRFRE